MAQRDLDPLTSDGVLAADSDGGGSPVSASLAEAAVRRALSGQYRAAAREVDRILDAAYALIRRRGTVELTIRELLSEAGMTTDAFYRLFKSKDAFVDLLVEDGGLRLASYLAHQVTKAVSAAKADGTDPAAAVIEAWIRGMLAQSANPDAAARGRPFVVHHSRLALSHGPAYQRLAEALTAPLADALAVGAAAGEARAGEIPDAIRCMYDLAMAASNRHLLGGTTPDAAELEYLVRFCLRALGTAPVGRPAEPAPSAASPRAGSGTGRANFRTDMAVRAGQQIARGKG